MKCGVIVNAHDAPYYRADGVVEKASLYLALFHTVPNDS